MPAAHTPTPAPCSRRRKTVAGRLSIKLAQISHALASAATASLFLIGADASGLSPAVRTERDRLIEFARAHNEGQRAFSFDISAYSGDIASLPIGVFDSGIGGLTVLEAILSLDAFHNDTLQPGPDGRRDFERERFIYFGDQSNMPYGNYPASGRKDYLEELIMKDAIFLLGRRYWPAEGRGPRFDKPPVKAIVIACNTATAYGLHDIRAALAAWKLPIPVIGVVEAAARGVMEQQPRTGTPPAIAVLATVATCSSDAYSSAIRGATGLAGKPAPLVLQHGCASLAGAIEGDPAFLLPGKDASSSVAAHIESDVRALAKRYLASAVTDRPPIGSIVLGCTHYPLVQNQIVAAFTALRDQPMPDGTHPYRALIARRLTVVNPAEFTARELFRSLALARLRSKAPDPSAPDLFFISVPNPDCPAAKLTSTGAFDPDYKYQRQPGHLDIEDTKIIPMRLNALPASSANLIREKLPAVSKRLR